MTEKTVNDAQNNLKKERFEFVLTVNGNIICQRYFRINGFRNESLSSMELVSTVDRCVSIIDDNLKAKSAIYHYNAAPQIFENVDEMKNWISTHYLEVPTYIALRNSDDAYVWNGVDVEPYTEFFNKSDFIASNENECVLKFSFIDNGPNYMDNEEHREVCSKIWDGLVYPRFVRTNIDLSNLRNKYEGGDVYAPFEANLVKLFNEDQPDLIPIIVKEICKCCSNSSKGAYTTSYNYGDKVYNFDIQNHNYKYFKSLEKAYKTKTENYFGKRA